MKQADRQTDRLYLCAYIKLYAHFLALDIHFFHPEFIRPQSRTIIWTTSNSRDFVLSFSLSLTHTCYTYYLVHSSSISGQARHGRWREWHKNKVPVSYPEESRCWKVEKPRLSCVNVGFCRLMYRLKDETIFISSDSVFLFSSFVRASLDKAIQKQHCSGYE